MSHKHAAVYVIVALCCQRLATPVHGSIAMLEPINGVWDPQYLAAFREAVVLADPGLNRTDANLLAMVWARTGEERFGAAASAALKMAASPTKPLWLARDKVWDGPAWYTFNLSNTTFQQPDRFSGCTDYGLLGYYILQTGGWQVYTHTQCVGC